MPYYLCKKALRRLFEVKGKAALVFVTVTFVSALLFALRYLLPVFMAIDLLSTDRKITTEFFVFTVFFFITSFLVQTPLKTGVRRWFYKVAEGEELNSSEIFFFFKKKRFLKSILLKLRVSFLKSFMALVIFLPSAGIIAEIIYIRNYSSDEALLSQIILVFIFMVVTICATSLYLIFSSGYFLTEYLIGDMTVTNAIKKSKIFMSRKRKSLFFVYLSFVIFIPIIYLYSNMALAFYARKLTSKEQKNDKQSIRCQKSCNKSGYFHPGT